MAADTGMQGNLDPYLHDGVYVFGALPSGADSSSIDFLGLFHEAEATTVIVAEPEAERVGLKAEFRAEWITLRVSSALDAVGLTAIVARALADAGISCNVVAAVDHDHLFVPAGLGDRAMEVLRALERSADSPAES